MDLPPSIEQFPKSSRKEGVYLIVDVETTGIPKEKDADSEEIRVIQLGWLLFDEYGKLIHHQNRYIENGIDIPESSTKIHGITNGTIHEKGFPPMDVWEEFLSDLENCRYVIGHNIDFDIQMIEAELKRHGHFNPFAGKFKFCTMRYGRRICQIPGEDGKGLRYPNLSELYQHCFSETLSHGKLSGLHDALEDAAYTSAIFFRLMQQSSALLQYARRIPYEFPRVAIEEQRRIRPFLLKVALPSFISLLLILFLAFVVILPRFSENIMREKRLMIKELSGSAWSVLHKFHQEATEGKFDTDTAKLLAIDAIRSLRYGPEMKDYFWLTDLKPTMLAHPYRPDLEGKYVGDFEDPAGKRLFSAFVAASRVDGEAYVDYQWQWKDDSTLIVPKLSYVRVFEPWGWIVGTGIYLDDVETEIASLVRNTWIVSGLITLLIVIALSMILRQSFKIDMQRQDAQHELRLTGEKYKGLAESATDALIMIMEGKIVFMNSVAHDLTGYDEDELLEQDYRLLFGFSSLLEDAFKGKGEINEPVEHLIHMHNGSSREVYLKVNRISISAREGHIISILNNPMVELIENRNFELIRKLGFAYFTASYDGSLYITRANEPMLTISGYHSLEDLRSTDLLSILEPQEQIANSLSKQQTIIDLEAKIRKFDQSQQGISISLLPLDDGCVQGMIREIGENEALAL